MLTSLLTENLPLKLLALLLGLIVYAHVYTEQEQEFHLKVPLAVSGLSPDLVLLEPPPRDVELATRGTGKQFLKLKMQESRILVDLHGVRPGQVQRMLSPADVAFPPGTEVHVTQILDPKMVVLAVDTLVERSVPVEPALFGEPPDNFVLVEPPRVIPPWVSVRGPRSLVTPLAHLETEPFDLGVVRSSREVELPVVSSLDGVTCDPASVSVSLLVEEEVTRVLTAIPVTVTNLAPGFPVRVEPDSAAVAVSGLTGALDALDPARISLELDLVGLGVGRHLLSPSVRLPRDSGANLQWVRPARFVVEIGRRTR